MPEHDLQHTHSEDQSAAESQIGAEPEAFIEDNRPASLSMQRLQQAVSNSARIAGQGQLVKGLNQHFVRRDNFGEINLRPTGLLQKRSIPGYKLRQNSGELRTGLEDLAYRELSEVKQHFAKKTNLPVQRASSDDAAEAEMNQALAPQPEEADDQEAGDDQGAEEKMPAIDIKTRIKHTHGALNIPVPASEAKKMGAPDSAFGNFQVGKVMEATLVPDDPVVGSATDGFPTWMKYLKAAYGPPDRNWLVQGHLLNHDLGGFGRPENLYPITTRANKLHAHLVEYPVKNALVRMHEYNEQVDTGKTKFYVEYKVNVSEVSNPPQHIKFECSWSEKYVGEKIDAKQLLSQAMPIESKFDDPKKASPFLTPDDKDIEIKGGSRREVNLPSWYHGSRRGVTEKRGGGYADISNEHSDKIESQRDIVGAGYDVPHFDARYGQGRGEDINPMVANWASDRKGRYFFALLCDEIHAGVGRLSKPFRDAIKLFIGSDKQNLVDQKNGELVREIKKYLAGIEYDKLPGYDQEMKRQRSSREAPKNLYFPDFDDEFDQWPSIQALLNQFLTLDKKDEKVDDSHEEDLDGDDEHKGGGDDGGASDNGGSSDDEDRIEEQASADNYPSALPAQGDVSAPVVDVLSLPASALSGFQGLSPFQSAQLLSPDTEMRGSSASVAPARGPSASEDEKLDQEQQQLFAQVQRHQVQVYMQPPQDHGRRIVDPPVSFKRIGAILVFQGYSYIVTNFQDDLTSGTTYFYLKLIGKGTYVDFLQ